MISVLKPRFQKHVTSWFPAIRFLIIRGRGLSVQSLATMCPVDVLTLKPETDLLFKRLPMNERAGSSMADAPHPSICWPE